jgi:tetratricopeptide (TPR) repeat protein
VNDEREYDLERVRADGWFDRVISGVPALERLCHSVGEPLIALALAAGFRVSSATVERTTGDVSTLAWVRDQPDGTEQSGSGPPSTLRNEVLATLLGDADPNAPLPEKPDADALRAFIGQRYLLLAPLFGLALRRLLVDPDGEARAVVGHDGIEEIVPVKQLRRFLRARIVDVLQGGRSRAVSIDLEQAAEARVAFDEGRYDEVVGKLAGWVAPLMMYHRTPEGAALDASTRADISRALGVLGRTFHKLGRADESEETLRLAVQYAHDSPAAGEMYRTLARTMIDDGRFGEAIAPLRRALSVDAEAGATLVDLARCYVKIGKSVAALACVRQARDRGADVEAVEKDVRAALGSSVAAFDQLVAKDHTATASK